MNSVISAVEYHIIYPTNLQLEETRMNMIDMDNCTSANSGQEGVLKCVQKSGEIFQVRNVYPPIQELQPRVLAVVIVFILCFIVGICGNASILTIIRGVMRERKTGGRSKRTGDNAILYIAALCVCDFLMSLSLPPAILDSIIGFWMFGTWICKLHHICGSVGRIVSTFLITSMSFDRYVAVCYPHHHRLRSRQFVLGVIFCVCVVAFLLLLPMLLFAAAKEMLLHELKAKDSNNITRVRVFKCSDMMPTEVFYWFTCSTFVLGYVVPLVLIVYFNMKLVRKVYAHKKVLPRSAIPVRRIVIYTLLIAFVYFVCWTPYWCSVLYAIVMSIIDVPQNNSDFVLFLIYVIHLLPYFGSSSNWVLYGLLNTQLQMKSENSEEHMSIITTANHHNGTRLTNGSGTRSICDVCRCVPEAAKSIVQFNRQEGRAATLVTSQSDQSMHFYEDTEQTHL